MKFVVAGEELTLDRDLVERTLAHRLPDPIQEHYVIVLGIRFPPKQVLAEVTGLDRADFTTHQARRILLRLGFQAARVHARVSHADVEQDSGDGPYGGRQAAALAPYVGKWVALSGPTEVLVAADSPHEVLGWLSRHGQRASYGMFRVPNQTSEAEGLAPA